MYITAHRVKALSTAQSGINAFLHLHGEDESVDWTQPDVKAVAETNTGKPVRKNVVLKPGANRVLSYLDVASADSMGSDRIVEALKEFERSIHGALPQVMVIEQIGIRFDAQAGLLGEGLVHEYKILRDSVVEILRAQESKAPST